MNDKQVKDNIKKGYANILNWNIQRQTFSSLFQCCDTKEATVEIGKKIGYSNEELKMVPESSNLGVGCGNPTALASIQKGEVILDLGSGAGFDCFLAAQETGKTGKVIGIDITPEMVIQAKKNAKKGNYKNVEFKVGDIENLPIKDNTIDLIISNCVINLSNEKENVFKEAYRVCKRGGRIMISDLILLKELPEYVLSSVEGHIACLSGTVRKEEYLEIIKQAGFKNISIYKEQLFPLELMISDPIAQKIIQDNNLSEAEVKNISSAIASISISATK